MYKKGKYLIIFGLGSFIGLLCLISSCAPSESRYTKTQVPTIPGANYVGSKKCAQCHEKQAEDFVRTVHGKLEVKSDKPSGEGCESCHGAGSLHVEAAGEGKILKADWNACYRCHSDKRAEFTLQYHHPVPEGRLGCDSCHGSLHSPAALSVNNETCFKCHQEKRGPWVFEHDAVREGCSTCHNAHGSINTKLLTERDYNLCLKCHFHSRYQSIGHYAHKRAVNPASLGAKYSNCTGCHRGVHGSNFSKELRTE